MNLFYEFRIRQVNARDQALPNDILRQILVDLTGLHIYSSEDPRNVERHMYYDHAFFGYPSAGRLSPDAMHRLLWALNTLHPGVHREIQRVFQPFALRHEMNHQLPENIKVYNREGAGASMNKVRIKKP